MKSVTTSAPGKFVILGEHAVVYGKPAIALAINLRFTMRAHRSSEFKINGAPANIHNMSPHMKYISELHGNMPMSVFIDGRVPSGSGLGSSAALSAAYAAAVRALKQLPTDKESIARKEDFLWRIEKNDRAWDISKIDVPEMTFVIGNTGIRAPTGPLVEKVRKYKDSNSFARSIVDEIGEVTLEGLDALKRNDKVKLGSLMTYDHKLLSILGVSCPQLNKLVDASLPYAYGAKLTGSGGGGCMVALTDQPEKVAEAITLHGGTPYIVSTGVPGVQIKY